MRLSIASLSSIQPADVGIRAPLAHQDQMAAIEFLGIPSFVLFLVGQPKQSDAVAVGLQTVPNGLAPEAEACEIAARCARSSVG